MKSQVVTGDGLSSSPNYQLRLYIQGWS